MKISSSVVLLSSWLMCAEALQAYKWCTGPFLRDTVKKCSADHNVGEEALQDFIFIRPAMNENSKCFRACIFEECLLFNKRGHFLKNVPQTTGWMASRRNPFHREIAELAAAYCVKQVPSDVDKCESTEIFYKCIAERAPVTITFEGAM
ncbi:uncharacterized protein LOC131802734 [Musca domestica]|uniref:Uncharacterized protein LOC131802734 n=1 Tax=Musca domestica TaxID=7370 RepID=A0ABM3V059_MUSDO|nr:uncharacterized protein LOC131802734 [Musca domestica]